MNHEQILIRASNTFGNARIILTATASSIGVTLFHQLEVKGKLDSSWRPVGVLTWIMGKPHLNPNPKAEAGDVNRTLKALA